MSKMTHGVCIAFGEEPDLKVSIEGQMASICVNGDGSVDHYLDAFKAALVAAGFTAHTAAKLTMADE